MESQPTLKTVDLPNGETFAYREIGTASKVLLLIHGALQSSTAWAHFMPKFADTFRVIAVDLRGFGQSTQHTPAKNHDENTDDIKVFVDAIGLKKFYIMGWSMGGGLSMKFAGRYPDYLEGLILLNSAGAQGLPIYKIGADGKPTTERIISEEDGFSHPHALFLATTLASKNLPMIKMMQEKTMYTGRNKPEEERFATLIEDWTTCRCVSHLPYFMNTFNVSAENNGAVEGTNEIAKIKCKVLILHGENDPVVKKEEAEKTKALLQDKAELKIFPDAGHAVIEDYPEEVVKQVKDFCSA